MKRQLRKHYERRTYLSIGAAIAVLQVVKPQLPPRYTSLIVSGSTAIGGASGGDNSEINLT